MVIYRSNRNPIISVNQVTASREDMEVIGVFNAGVTRFEEEIILLLRVAERPAAQNESAYLTPIYDPDLDKIVTKSIRRDIVNDFSDVRVIRTEHASYLTSISHLRLARSTNGVDFSVDPRPAFEAGTIYETFGVEDPRITKIADTFYITYSAVSDLGIVVGLLSTKDFKEFTREGNIFHPDNKDVVILPERIRGKYYAIHRPSCSHYGKPEMWIAESTDLLQWGNHRFLMGLREGYWDNGRIGASAVPFQVDGGWLEIYHGADKNNRYCLGAVLLDLDEPWKVIARSEQPLMFPETNYELEGFFGNVIFSCGALCEDGIVKIYYGAGDSCIGYAETSLDYVMEHLRQMKRV